MFMKDTPLIISGSCLLAEISIYTLYMDGKRTCLSWLPCQRRQTFN
uniref:Uncharacterized protein n=1 Tax=Rhizophora mucronata TaxID=61149 RepID=A0A2P2QHY5_RHIMU